MIFKTGGDDRDDVRCGEYADENNHRSDEREDAEDGVRDARRFLLVVLGQQFCVDGNERRGECALAEDVLQEVWDAKRGAECVAFAGTAEVMSKDSLPDQADDATDENPRADKERGPSGAGRVCGLGDVGRRWSRGRGRRRWRQ